ncbi:MAG: NADH-quinone oxidoreductase subunit C [SAR202 cluster bacterium]|nr:NADH-quinone oxidoreductase subunit C [SAR202 cluster bacterium]
MSTVMPGGQLVTSINQRLPETALMADAEAVWVRPDAIREVCALLKETQGLEFNLLSSVTAVDYVEHFDVVYRLTSIPRNATAVVKARVFGRERPTLPSVSVLWKGAELQEREAYDLLGVVFSGHPNLKRILTWEGFKGHPLRRDYLEPPLPYSWPHGG